MGSISHSITGILTLILLYCSIRVFLMIRSSTNELKHFGNLAYTIPLRSSALQKVFSRLNDIVLMNSGVRLMDAYRS